MNSETTSGPICADGWMKTVVSIFLVDRFLEGSPFKGRVRVYDLSTNTSPLTTLNELYKYRG